MTYIRPLYTMAVFVQQTWPCLEHARSCLCLGGSSWPFLWLGLVECRSATAICIAHHCEELEDQVNILNFHIKIIDRCIFSTVKQYTIITELFRQYIYWYKVLMKHSTNLKISLAKVNLLPDFIYSNNYIQHAAQ